MLAHHHWKRLRVSCQWRPAGRRGKWLWFFHARARREVYVQLAAEDQGLGDEKKCGKLNYSMYGVRDAAQNWANEYAEVLISIGFKQGKSAPCVLFHEERNIRTFVHRDDYVSSAMPSQFKWMKERLEKQLPIENAMVGTREGVPTRSPNIKSSHRLEQFEGYNIRGGSQTHRNHH